MKTREVNLEILLQFIDRISAYIRFHIESLTTLRTLELMKEMVDGSIAGNCDLDNYRQEFLHLFSQEDDSRKWMQNALALNTIVVRGDISRAKEISKYLPMIQISIEEGLRQINLSNYDRAFDLVDILHCLPSALTNENWNEQDFWETYISAYRSKWNEDYLRDIESTIRK